MNINQIEEARALAPIIPINISASADSTPAIVIQYVPDLGSGGTKARVKVTTSGLYADVDAVAATEDSSDKFGNSTGWLLFATYTNMGLLVDAINAHACFRAYLVCALRNDQATPMKATAITSVTGGDAGDHGRTFYFDTNKSDFVGAAISGEKFLNSGINGHVTDSGDRCENSMYYLGITVSGEGYLRFYSSSHSADTKLLADISVNGGTFYDLNESAIMTPYIQAVPGQRLIVRVNAVTATTELGPTVWNMLGKTAVLSGSRIVDEDCF